MKFYLSPHKHSGGPATNAIHPLRMKPSSTSLCNTPPARPPIHSVVGFPLGPLPQHW